MFVGGSNSLAHVFDDLRYQLIAAPVLAAFSLKILGATIEDIGKGQRGGLEAGGLHQVFRIEGGMGSDVDGLVGDFDLSRKASRLALPRAFSVHFSV